jgi:hypothetical protein
MEMQMVRFLLVISLASFLFGCAQHGGGGDYQYKRFDPVTGNIIMDVSVHSVREFDSAQVNDGDSSLIVEGVRQGPNNLGKALDIISKGIKTGILVAP